MGQYVSKAAAAAAHLATAAEVPPASVKATYSQTWSTNSSQSSEQPKELKTENEKLKLELHALKGKCQHLEEAAKDRKEMEKDIQDVFSQLEKERDQYKERFVALVGEHSEAQKHSHELRKKGQSVEAENRKLQDQVTQFKSLISTSSHIEHQVADDVIRQESEAIFYSIQAFVVNKFKRVECDFFRMNRDSKSIMQEYAPQANALPKGFWLDIINSLIAQLMVESFEQMNLFGASGKGPVVAAKELVRTFGGNPNPKWLITTRKLLHENAGDALQKSDDQLAQNLARAVHKELRRVISVEWTSEMHDQLVDIFKRAHDFYRLVYSQQSQLKVLMVKAMVDTKIMGFNPREMEVVNSDLDDETARAGHAIEVSIFPGVYKEVAGGTTITIAKAKVVPRLLLIE